MSYYRNKAVEYALHHYNGWDTTKYPDFDSQNSENTDCANFVSQCLHAGGIPMQKSNNRYANWYCYSARDKGDSWAGAQSLRLALKNGHLNGIKIQSLSSPNGLKRGDLIFKLDNTAKEKSQRKAHHVMMLIEDYKGDPAVICQRGVKPENRYILYHVFPEKKNMLFYHIVDNDISIQNPLQGNWEERYGKETLKRSRKYNPYVENMQGDLKIIGYDCGKADGYFGNLTEQQVKKFQEACGLTVDGIFGRQSKQALWESVQKRE